MSSDKHREQHVQSFSVQSIRDRILPDPDATPEERIKTLEARLQAPSQDASRYYHMTTCDCSRRLLLALCIENPT